MIHEAWTSGATENFLDPLRKLLSAARDEAIAPVPSSPSRESV
ncbi:hypothetical protein ACWCQM_34495 [Streptomyces sp. NPDC002125]